MEATDIARITFELIRTRDDRQLMQWEDDRGNLLREIYRLQSIQLHNTKIHSKLQEDFVQIQQLVFTKLNKKISASSDMEPQLKKRSRPDIPLPLEVENGQILIRNTPKNNSSVAEVAQPIVSVPISDESVKFDDTKNAEKSNKIIRRYSTSNIQLASSSKPPNQTIKYVEGGRKQSIRDALPGFNCNQCKAYYLTLIEQGNYCVCTMYGFWNNLLFIIVYRNHSIGRNAQGYVTEVFAT